MFKLANPKKKHYFFLYEIQNKYDLSNYYKTPADALEDFQSKGIDIRSSLRIKHKERLIEDAKKGQYYPLYFNWIKEVN